MALEDIPSYVADGVGVNLVTAQLILSVAIIFALLLPTMYLARGKNAPLIWITMLFLSICLCSGLGWMPFWILITTTCIIALALAKMGTDIVAGSG